MTPLGKNLRLILLFALGMIWFTLPEMKAFAGDIYSPKRGTAERKHIMNAIRPLLEVRVGAPVEFVVDRLRIYQSWAFAVVNPQRPGGKAISPDSSTYHISEFSDGLHSYVLLKYAYKRWNIVDYAIGPTDVFWIGDPLYEQFPPDFIN